MTDTPPPADKKAETDQNASKQTDTVEKKTTGAKPASKAAAKAAPKSTSKKSATKSESKPKSVTKKAVSKADGSSEKKAAAKKTESASAPKSDVAPKPNDADNVVPKVTTNVAPGLAGYAAPIAVAAVLGAALALVLQMMFGMSSNDQVTQAEFETLQSQVERSALAAGDPEAVGRLQVRLDGMEEDLRVLNSGVARASDVTVLESSLNETRERLAVVEAGSGRSSRSGRASNSEIAALETRISELDGENQTQISQLNNQIASLEGDLVARLDSLVQSRDFVSLATRVATLEDDQLAQEMYKAATALGLAQLARTAQGSESFVIELEALSALRPGDPFVSELRPLAQSGIATSAMLASEFSAVSRQVMNAHRASEDQGWAARIWARITQLVSFRRTGDIEGDTVEAILARAELRLDEGNLSAAVAEMVNLSEAASVPATDWLTQAQGRVALNNLIAGLSTEVIGELER